MTKKEHIESITGNPIPWITGVLLLFCLAIAGGIYWHHTNKVERIHITGIHFINKQNLKKQITIPVGIDADSLSYEAIRHQLKAVPYVESVRFHLKPGGTLTIDITERTPIAMLVDGQKRIYIDKYGIRLKKKPGMAVNVPILYGFPINPKHDSAETKALQKTLLFLQKLYQDKAADATISEVVWNPNHGVIALTNNNGVKVIFGKRNFTKRLRKYDAFFRAVIRKEGINRFHSIDLRFDGQIVTRED